MNEPDFEAFRYWDSKQPDPPPVAEIDGAVIRALAADDKPLSEYEVVTRVIKALRPKAIWYQTIVDRLKQLERDKRVGSTKVKDQTGYEAGVWYEEIVYTLVDPLDRMAGI